jgi:glycosyltransferase involved in cell wall biosynthesis
VPRVSIIIPTNRSPEVFRRCLASIAWQGCDPGEIEVIVVFNGMRSPPPLDGHAWPFALVTDHIEPAHIGAAKNVALERARGEWVIFLNDDVVLDSDFVAAHLAAHRELCEPAMVLGRSVWQRYDDETIFDRMVQTTSMVFFYDQMKPHGWYGFRHAWNLNLSLARRFVETLRFDERLGPFFYEDLELAYRLEHQHGLRVWYASEALLLHDHRYTLDRYLEREFAMGQVVPGLWRCNPDCFRATYGADLDRAYIDYCRQFVRREGRHEAERRARLEQLVARRPAELTTSPGRQAELIRLLYDTHLPLKRLAFRRGLLSAVVDDACSDLLMNARPQHAL